MQRSRQEKEVVYAVLGDFFVVPTPSIGNHPSVVSSDTGYRSDEYDRMLLFACDKAT